jgi:hypothetical protein
MEAARERQRYRFAGSERLVAKGDIGPAEIREVCVLDDGKSFGIAWQGAAAGSFAAVARHCTVASTGFVHRGHVLPSQAAP